MRSPKPVEPRKQTSPLIKRIDRLEEVADVVELVDLVAV
jgi:hypothetical protein